MVPFGREFLFPPRVLWRRICATNIAGDYATVLAQLRQRPLKIDNREAAVFPICNRFFAGETIEIDCNVNVAALQIPRERRKFFAPIFAQNCAAPLSIFRRAIVCPRVNFQFAFTLGAMVAENIVRPPVFEISAPPDADPPHVRIFQSTIDPAAAPPFRRTNVPVRMIIERNQLRRLSQTANPQTAQMMKISRTEQQKRRERRFDFGIEFFYYSRRRRKT